MPLPREKSLAVGLATVGLVWGVYNVALPTIADVRVGEAGDRDASAAERTATWAAAAVVSGVALLAQDPTVFIMGGAAVIFLAWSHRHANHFDPSLGSVFTPGASRQVMGDAMSADAGYTPSP